MFSCCNNMATLTIITIIIKKISQIKLTTGNFSIRILYKMGVQYSIADLVAHFI